MEKITLKQIRILIYILFLLGFVISVAANINGFIEKKVETVRKEAREEGRISILQNMGDLVRQGQKQIIIPYAFMNNEGKIQTTTILFMPVLPQPTPQVEE